MPFIIERDRPVKSLDGDKKKVRRWLSGSEHRGGKTHPVFTLPGGYRPRLFEERSGAALFLDSLRKQGFDIGHLTVVDTDRIDEPTLRAALRLPCSG